MSDPVENPSPAEALDSIRQSREQLQGEVFKGSWSYDFKYAALCGLLVGGQGLPTPFQLAATLICTVALVLLLRGWIERTGVTLTGYSPPHARWVAIGFGVVMAGGMLGVMFGTRQTGLWQIPVAGGLIAAGLAFVASRLWWKVYQSETKVGR